MDHPLKNLEDKPLAPLERARMLLAVACDEFETTPDRLLARQAQPRPIEKLALVAFLLSIDIKLSDFSIASILFCSPEEAGHLRCYIAMAFTRDLDISHHGMNIRDRLADMLESRDPHGALVAGSGSSLNEHPKITEVLDTLSRASGVSVDEMRAAGKKAKPSAARSVGFVLLRHVAGIPMGRATTILGRREYDGKNATRRMRQLWRTEKDHWQCKLFTKVCEQLDVDPDQLISLDRE